MGVDLVEKRGSPVTEMAADCLLRLPFYYDLTEHDLDQVITLYANLNSKHCSLFVRIDYLWMPWIITTNKVPNNIKPIEVVLPIKLTALPGLPPIYKPHPTMAITPAGIKGHHTNLSLITFEQMVIKSQAKAKHTKNKPVLAPVHLPQLSYPTPDKHQNQHPIRDNQGSPIQKVFGPRPNQKRKAQPQWQI